MCMSIVKGKKGGDVEVEDLDLICYYSYKRIITVKND